MDIDSAGFKSFQSDSGGKGTLQGNTFFHTWFGEGNIALLTIKLCQKPETLKT